MKLPLKLEYACRVMIQLKPTFVSGEVRRVEDLADLESVSPNYLVQILTGLRTAGLVESRRGKHGGYLLAKNPEEVTLGDIVAAAEGALLQLNGTPEGQSGPATARLWRRLFEDVEVQLRRRRLADMGTGESAAMWHI
jgi:Rrf2 family transcriptional regulator, cysteine metabolism repressor